MRHVEGSFSKDLTEYQSAFFLTMVHDWQQDDCSGLCFTCSSTHSLTPLTCQSLEAMELEDVRFQHLDPWTSNFRGQLWTYRKQPGVKHKVRQFNAWDRDPDIDRPHDWSTGVLHVAQWQFSRMNAWLSVSVKPGCDSRVEHRRQHQLLIRAKTCPSKADRHWKVWGIL